MGSVVENQKTKEKCQIFTPDDVVKDMLDYVGYVDHLYGKKVLESACGNGRFLKEIVIRYIHDGISRGLTKTKIKNGLGRDIFGIELDPLRYQECLNALDSITDSFGLKRVKWKIKQADALREPYMGTFDFVVGNPPYVSYWDLDQSERRFVEEKYTACQFGAWDYSYAFLQDGFEHLNDKGKMAYIIPNSTFKTKSGRKVRSVLQNDLVEIIDYTTISVFDNVLTSPAVIVIDRTIHSRQIRYRDLSNSRVISVDKATLGTEWVFDEKERSVGLKHRFGDYFKVSTGIATQRNKVYVLSKYSESDEYFLYNDKKIEKKAVHKAASPRGMAKGAIEYIIFPYYYSNGELMHYDEKRYEEEYPFTYAYLKTQKEELRKRDSDKNSKWFEYGRSQGLAHINQNKILLSTVITGKVRAYPLAKDEIPYSGLFITARNQPNALPLTEAMAILTSDEFLHYLVPRGINARGKSIRITANVIENYCW